MSKKPLTISDEAKVQMPMKTVASLIALVAIGTWAYFGINEKLNQHSTKLERAEGTWEMAENLYEVLADKVRQMEYDIKDLNREINY